MNNKQVLTLVCAALVAVLFVGSFLTNLGGNAYGAPMGAPTPLAVTQYGQPGNPKVVTWFAAQSVTADTTSPCIDLSQYNMADIYYSINGAGVNTTTLTLKFGNTSGALVSGVNVAATKVTPTSDLQPLQLFGACTAILADVSNATPVAITVNARVH